MSDLDLYLTDEVVEKATVASINVSLAPWGEAITTTDHLQGGVEALAETRAALEAALPGIIQQAKAEALREAAEEFWARLPDGTGNGRAYNSHRVADMLRARADEIAGDDS